MAEKDDRDARLAQKLRENLRKRKARARGERTEGAEGGHEAGGDPPSD